LRYQGGIILLVFGPVPSRRLGRSLGINNIPPKACSYSCVYCQLGPTRATGIVPRKFYAPDLICREVENRLAQVRETGSHVDYLTFVPDGEPTLDSLLGESIERLRPLGIPVAVISNASLLWREEVREILMKADWVSLKVDAIDATLWRRINRPHPSLDHAAILDGMSVFADDFSGTLVTESMIVRGLNDDDQAANDLAGFLGKLGPDIAYLSVPTRPPAEKHVRAPGEVTLNRIYQIVSRKVGNLQLLTGYEGNAFASGGDVAENLLSITSVHPMREEAVRKLLDKAGAHWCVVEQLIADEKLKQTEYEGIKFYVRRIPDKCE
jgi:wyosine [tRNA(Phe)-imidazoG37] synthetase (radical SAM superfamily)